MEVNYALAFVFSSIFYNWFIRKSVIVWSFEQSTGFTACVDTRFVWKVSEPKFSNSLFVNLYQSSLSLTIIVPLWFIIISLVFFYLRKQLFFQFKVILDVDNTSQNIVSKLLQIDRISKRKRRASEKQKPLVSITVEQ